MKKRLEISGAALGVLILSLLCLPSLLLAQDVKLAWDASESPNVAGYRIYYKADSTEMPLDGIEALQGPSPIDVGNVTSFTLTELPEGFVYYFRATAYDSEGNESTYSNLASSEWIPAPISPEMGEMTETQATLVWSQPPQGRNLKFTVLYGTKEKPRKNETALIGSQKGGDPQKQNGTAPLLAVLACLVSLSCRQLKGQFGKKRLLALGLCLGLALSTASCGGGGGGGGGGSAPASLSQDDDTVVITGLTDNYLVTEELEEGTTYYWQVIAVDDNGQEYESEISSFIAG